MKKGDLVKWNYPNSTDVDAPTIGVIVSEYSDNNIQSYWNVKWLCESRPTIRPISKEYLEVFCEGR